MMALLRAARWEWFKLRRRWRPWVLLVILAVVTQAVIWGAFTATLNLERVMTPAAALAARAKLTEAFTLPGSLATAMLPVRQVVVLILALLVASVVGEDYALGTYRPMAAGGTPRWALLGGKLAMVAAASLAAFVVLTAGVVASSLAAAL